jgi:hypothetical protein
MTFGKFHLLPSLSEKFGTHIYLGDRNRYHFPEFFSFSEYQIMDKVQELSIPEPTAVSVLI